jgi:eukaryotic-like serine/threonine-protein kinase
MGVVYKAKQLSLDRVVALKMVLHGPFSSEEFVRRFRTEAQAAAGLHHPGIVPIYEVGHQNGHHYFSMEYIAGRNLAEEVRQNPLPARRAARYLKLIAQAMQYAHEQGVVHRDLKPSNVLLDALDQPRITDFGLAKLLNSDSQMTITGQALGSPQHMPPEQAAGKLALTGPAGDIYSLGAILYHLLTGRPPFQGDTLQEILLQVQTVDPVPPRRLNASVPVDLQTICLKCLEKDPLHRYESAKALAEDIGHFLADEPIAARPPSPARKVSLWCRRHPVPAALSVALLLTVVIGLAGILAEWRRASLSAAGELKQRRIAEASAGKTRLNLYAADVSLASQALQRRDLGLARRTLDGLRPRPGETDLRGFEWRYLWNQCQSDELAKLTGHTWIVTCAAFSPDGRWLATGSQDGTAKVWEVLPTKNVATLPDHGAVWSVEFSPDGAWLMTAGNYGVTFWSTETWQPVKKFPGHLAALSKTGSRVAISESSRFYFESLGPVTLWDYRSGQKLREFGRAGRAVALSAEGKLLAVAGASSDIGIWNTEDGKLLRTLSVQRPVWSLAFSPDGRRLLSAGWTSDVLLWDLKNEQTAPQKLEGHSLTVWSAQFSPDGSAIATAGSDQTIRLWDAVTLIQKEVFRGHENEVWCAVFRPDGAMLASGGKDQTVRLWPGSLTTINDSFPHESDAPFSLSPNGSKLLVYQAQNQVAGTQLWDLATRMRIAEIPNWAGVGFSPDGGRIVCLDVEEPALVSRSGSATDEGWKRIKLSDTPAGSASFERVGFSPDYERFFAIDAHGLIRICDAGTGKLLNSFGGPAPPIRKATLGPAGRRLAVSVERENILHLFETATGREKQISGHRDFVSGLAFSPDGKTLASGGMDAAIVLWDAATATPTANLSGHMEEVTDLAFTPDGQTLASLAHRDSIKLWHLPTGRELLSIPMRHAGLLLQFSPDGHRLAVGTDENTVKVIEAPADTSQAVRAGIN